MQAGDMNTMKKCSTCGTLYSAELCPQCMAGFAQKPTDPTQPPEELPLRPGQTFHGLEILQLLGRGGMGVVYKARQPTLDRLIALKILPQKMALDPDFQNRFIREAKALGSLNHPNIVAVYDFGAEGGLFFFAMEYVDGTNLRQVLRDRKLTPDQALKLVPQLCDALEYAHEEGVVHRDIKPENILLDRKGRVKIADFGLAKLVGADVAAAGLLTMTNMVMGTPHYMAPEQVENPKSVDHRADIYSIGVVFYEMLTGELPIGRFEVPSKKVQVDVRLDEVVLKALEKAPDRRYQKASDVKEALTRVTAVASPDSYSPTIVTPVPARKPSRRSTIAMGAVTVLALGVALLAVLTRPKAQPPLSGPVSSAAVEVSSPLPPRVPEVIDFTPLYFGPEERPLGHALLTGDRERPHGLPRNPFPAKDRSELEHVASFLDDVGLRNVSPADLKQAYVSVWWGCTFAVLDTPIAERLEQEISGLVRIENRWSRRKGSLLVFVIAGRREARALHNALVALVQKKLGLPVEPPDIPLENLKFAKHDLPSGWSILKEAVTPGDSAWKYEASFKSGDREVEEIGFQIEKLADPARAEAAEKSLRLKWPSTSDVVRSGRIVGALIRRSDHVGAFVKLRGLLREWMGLPVLSFDGIVPNETELPKGYSFEKVDGDINSVVGSLGFADLKPDQFARAWRASLKPAGKIVLLQAQAEGDASSLQNRLREGGPTEYKDGFVFGVEGPDDPTLDALENLMRVKFGWDPNRPRAIRLAHARPSPADLPDTFALSSESIEQSSYSCEMKGASFTLQCKIVETHDYGRIDQAKKAMPYRPGDLLLEKDTVVVWIGGAGEASWPALDKLELTYRKKMRMDPPTSDEFALRTWELPKGTLFSKEATKKNSAPRIEGVPEELTGGRAHLASQWRALIEPSGTWVFVWELEDAEKAAAHAKTFVGLKGAGDRRLATYVRGPFVALVFQSPKKEDRAFEDIAQSVRGKLRAAP